MNRPMEIISKYSAIPSWEGFEYQGHISLYVAIKEIFNIINNSEINKITPLLEEYILLIESIEDFAIKKKDRYLSIHQVKSGDSSLKPNDKFCFIISLLQYEVEKGYYHIAPNSKQLDIDFTETTIKIIKSYLEKLKNKNYKIDGRTPKGSLEKILYDFTKDCVEEDIQNKLDELKLEFENHNKTLNGKKDNDYIEEYKEKFNSSADIIKESCKIIEKILEKINPNGLIYYDNLYFRFVYNEIKLKLEKSISEANTKTDKYNCIIKFKDIYETIIEDHKNNNNTVDYQYYVFFNLIIDEFKKYPTYSELCSCKNCKDCNQKASCNLYCEISRIFINELDYEKFPELLYNLLLRTPKNNLPLGETIGELFFKLLQEINILQCNDSNIFLAEKHNEFYRLTLVENRRTETFLELLQNDENSILHKDKTFLFESDVLITDILDDIIINHNQQGFNVLGKNELNEIEENYKDLENLIENRKKDITKAKIIRIIDTKKAREELL